MPTEGSLNAPFIGGWHDCGFVGETIPDVHPKESSAFGVKKRPNDGNAYLGMVVRDNKTWESIGQKLKSPLKKDTPYLFKINLARSLLYESQSKTSSQIVNFATPCKLRIWGGSTECGKEQLLAESALITHSRWVEYIFKLMPSSNWSHIILEAFYKTPVPKPYNGNLLIDHATGFFPTRLEYADSIELQKLDSLIERQAKDYPYPTDLYRIPINKPKLIRYEFESQHLDTDFKIVFYADSIKDASKIATAVFNRIEALEQVMSNYRADSELNQLLSISGTNRRMKLSDDLWNVLKLADEITEESNGAFDYTAGTLTKLWRKAFQEKEIPTEEEIEKAKTTIGKKNVKLFKGQYMKIWKKGIRLDLGGIAKGYAIDEALKVLKQNGITKALVDGGGNIAVSDPPPSKKSWKLKRLEYNQKGELTTVPVFLNNQAIATSGPTEKYLEQDGKRYSHIIDPRTGYGITKSLFGVKILYLLHSVQYYFGIC